MLYTKFYVVCDDEAYNPLGPTVIPYDNYPEGRLHWKEAREHGRNYAFIGEIFDGYCDVLGDLWQTRGPELKAHNLTEAIKLVLAERRLAK